MKPTLGLRTTQHLALTPQLQQSIRLLQMSTAELEQEIERYVSENPLLEIDDALELRLEDQETRSVPDQLISFEDMERSYILKVLERTQWVIEGEQGAAAILDLNPSTLRSRMQKLNIRKAKFSA